MQSDAAAKLELWFFRDMLESNRLRLFELFGFKPSEMDTMAKQQMVFRRILAALSTDAKPVKNIILASDSLIEAVLTFKHGHPWNEFAGKREAELERIAARKMLELYVRFTSPAPSVAVKALEWQKVALGTLDWNWLGVETASTAFGDYLLQKHDTGHLRVMFGGKVVNFFEPEKHTDARAAAQADYEARILSALSAQVQDVAGQDDTHLEEIADGAWGDDPATRGRARDQLARRRPAAPAKQEGGHD